jgi:hypothetical protein
MSQEERRAGGDRRATPRAPMKASVSLTFTGELQGETLNMSPRGTLLRAKGFVHVLFRFQGHEHQGRLVRVDPADSDGADYGIKLRDSIA